MTTSDARDRASRAGSRAPRNLRLKQVLALAGILGLALGLVGALVVESMDKRIADVASFERSTACRAPAVVPQKSYRPPRPALGSGDLEPFRILRTAVDFAQVRVRSGR